MSDYALRQSLIETKVALRDIEAAINTLTLRLNSNPPLTMRVQIQSDLQRCQSSKEVLLRNIQKAEAILQKPKQTSYSSTSNSPFSQVDNSPEVIGAELVDPDDELLEMMRELNSGFSSHPQSIAPPALSPIDIPADLELEELRRSLESDDQDEDIVTNKPQSPTPPKTTAFLTFEAPANSNYTKPSVEFSALKSALAALKANQSYLLQQRQQVDSLIAQNDQAITQIKLKLLQ